MLGYDSALDVDPKYAVSSPKANYYGENWIFNDLNCSLNTDEDYEKKDPKVLELGHLLGCLLCDPPWLEYPMTKGDILL